MVYFDAIEDMKRLSFEDADDPLCLEVVVIIVAEIFTVIYEITVSCLNIIRCHSAQI